MTIAVGRDRKAVINFSQNGPERHYGTSSWRSSTLTKRSYREIGQSCKLQFGKHCNCCAHNNHFWQL